MTSPTSPPPPPAVSPPPAPPGASGAAVAGGVGGGAVLIYIVDRMLADNGNLAATMLTQLSPILGPVWASWPLIGLVAALALLARNKWAAAQHVRAIEVAAQRQAAEHLATSVGEVATGLAGLRGEVHDLRQDLRVHADTTDARFRATDENLRDFVKSEVSPLCLRIDALERKPTRRR